MFGVSNNFPYRKIFISALLYIFILTIASISIQNGLKDAARKNISDVISTVLGITHEGVHSWYKEEQAETLIWASNATVQQYASQLLATPKNQNTLVESPAQNLLRQWFAPVLAAKGYNGFFIIGPDGINLASTRDINLGSTNLLKKQDDFFDRVLSGKVTVSVPLPSDVPLTAPDGRYVEGLPTMFVGAPIINGNGEKIAILAFRLDPFADFSAILQRGRIGPSGETYAFDKRGRMVSESRFTNQLIDIGLLGENTYSAITLELHDPGGNLLKGEGSILERDKQPLTLMARKATSGESGMNVDGYRDYRGVKVVGAWLWDDELNLGIASEIDYDEAFADVIATQRIITFATVFLAILGTGLGIFIMLSREKELSRKAIKERATRLAMVLNGVPHGIIMIDSDGRLQAWNTVYKDIFNLPDELLKVGIEGSKIILHNAEQSVIGEEKPQLLTGDQPEQPRKDATYSMEVTMENGKIYEVVNLHTQDGDHLSTATDITERKKAEETLKHLATHDALTGLPSLLLGKDRLTRAVCMARRDKTMAALFFLDIDGFKSANDTFGHEAGDQLLIEFGKRLKSCVREVDTVARIGGDEFLIVLTNITDISGVEKVAKLVIETIGKPFKLPNCEVTVGVSIGIALYPHHGEETDEIIKKADEAMYAVKRKGKNNYKIAE